MRPVRMLIVIMSACCISFAACNTKSPESKNVTATIADSSKIQRFGMVTGLKPEKMAYYKQLHANAWPAVLKKIKECNIRNYSIYLQKIEGKIGRAHV